MMMLMCVSAHASSVRTVRTINDGWRFTKEGTSVQVHLPHTWNAADCLDDEDGYWRGECRYEKVLELGDEIAGRKVYIRFEGAFQETSLFVNGNPAGKHAGGYTAFIFDITPFVRKGPNDILVKLDNSYNEDIPTLTADFTFFGGIYRDVELIVAPEILISPDMYASSGVLLSTPHIGADHATVKAVTYLTNATASRRTLVLEHRLIAPDGSTAAVSSRKVKLAGGTMKQATELFLEVDDPVIWDIDRPELYNVVTSIYNPDKNGMELIDRVSNPLGFRSFGFDPDKGFTLNGRNVKIIGTNRHQDYLGLGNALGDEFHERDVRLLKEMGGNFLRIAHYPQDPVVVDECDRLGIVNSVEIPVVNTVSMTDAFRDNCIEMAREMVCQGYNHPSTIIWAYMNEVLLGPPFNSKTTAEQKKAYYDHVCALGQGIDNAITDLDPGRPTMIPCNCKPEIYKESGLGGIPGLLGWNIYNGWYSGELSDFGHTLDKIHSLFPDKPLLVTEYGADNDIRIHSFKSERFDFSVEYAVRYHREYLKTIRGRDFVAGANVWNLADFHSEARGDAMPHINCKGLATADRIPKDSYFYYKAMLSERPQAIISGRDWLERGGDEDEYQPVSVFTNQPEVELFLNGIPVGSQRAEDGIAVFSVRFNDGDNVLMARAGGAADILRIGYHAIPSDMARFKSLNVTMGNCFFEDKESGTVWIPVKEYEPGSWGVVGGVEGRKKTRRGSQPRSNMNVFGTTADMLFQTQYHGLEAFKADVPDGRYHIYLYFCDFDSGKNGRTLIYNLGNDVIGEKASDRVFDVTVNGTAVIPFLDISKAVGYQRPLIKKISVDVTGGEGLSVGFKPIIGETLLCAIRIYKCH